MTTLKDEIAERKEKPRTVVRGDRPVAERVASRAVEDRAAVEAAYRSGDAAVRRAILEAAAKNPDAAPLEVLRLALFGTDPEMARLARAALAATSAPEATALLNDALRSPMEPAEREALVAALSRVGANSPRARWLSAAHRGLGAKSTAIDGKAWLTPGAEYPSAANEKPVSAEGKDAAEQAERTLAEALAALEGDDPRERKMAALRFEDARREALRAEELGAGGWRTRTVQALAAYYAGKKEEAYPLAEAAVKDIPPGDRSWNSMAVLTVFAEGRWKAIKEAVKAKREYPPSWLADLHTVYSVLLRHPCTTDARIDWHCELLLWLGVQDQAARVLREGLARFPASEILHARLRKRTLEERGAAGLEAVYAELLKGPDAPAELKVFAARASVEAAEQYRRNRKVPEALAAYGRALDLYGTSPPSALVLAGRARLEFQAGDDEKALEDVLASLERAPEMAGTLDGMGIHALDTARVLLARLKERGKAEAAARLEAAVAKVPPAGDPGGE
jgi:tetratricopeptide (TPR) repeat protein